MAEGTVKPAKNPRGLRRRHVLVGAGAVAGGLAITKALGLYNLPAPGQTQSPTAAGIDWISPPAKPEAQVAHLLRRSALGAAQAGVQAPREEGVTNTADRS